MTLYTNGLILANNIIASNSSGLWRYPYLASQPLFLNNCVHNSNAVNYVNLSAGTGDIQNDPQFANLASGNLHLLATSPCIDAGTNTLAAVTDFDSVPRPLDGNTNGLAVCDMGAFEFAHPQADTDGDRMLDPAEIIAGTDPTDPSAWLRVSVRLLSLEGVAALEWLSVTGRTYCVEHEPALAPPGSWQPLATNLAGSGTLLEWRDSAGAAAARFYRVGVTRD